MALEDQVIYQVNSIRCMDDGDVMGVTVLGPVGTIPRTGLKVGDCFKVEVLNNVKFAENKEKSHGSKSRR